VTSLSLRFIEKEVTFSTKNKISKQQPNPNPKYIKEYCMSTEENPPAQPASPSPSKNKKRGSTQEKILINLKGLDEAKKRYHEVLKKCNDKVYGRAITATDIFGGALLKLTDSDITNLQKASITTDLDLLKYEWSRDQSKKEEQVDFNAWLIKRLKLKPTHLQKH